MKRIPSTPRGQVLLLALVFFGVFFTLVVALVAFLFIFLRSEQFSVARAQALALAEAGIEKTIYELNQNPLYLGETNTALGTGTFTTAVTTIDTNTRLVTASGEVPAGVLTARRTVTVRVALSSAVISFRYGMQAGTGGVTMANSSQVIGNVFANGPVIGDGGNLVDGSVVSAGAGGLTYGVYVTGAAYAHTIGGNKATEIDGDAFYAASLTNTTVNGTTHPGSPDQPTADFPISDAQVEEWKAHAESGGVIPSTSCNASGDYLIQTSQSLGPIKIECNLVLKSTSAILNVTGPIWVVGNIDTQTGPTISLDGTLGNQNVPIIADNPSNPNGSGIIQISQQTNFDNSETPGSFVFLISQNRSAENGGSTVAISLSQGAAALVAYASHGLITMNQSVGVKEATGYEIALAQSASVTYDSGLPSSVFQAGPGGGWIFVPGTYSIAEF